MFLFHVEEHWNWGNKSLKTIEILLILCQSFEIKKIISAIPNKKKTICQCSMYTQNVIEILIIKYVLTDWMVEW